MLAAIGYSFLGAAGGGLSLIFWPRHLLHNPVLRYGNLLLTPVAVGVCMAWMGARRARRGTELVRIDHFGYAYLFALMFALARFADML